MVHGGFKNDLPRKTTSDKVLRDKTVNIPKNLKYDGYQREIASLPYRCFGKKSSGSGAKSEIMSNQQLAEELQKPIIRNLKTEKCTQVKENIWGAVLGDMQMINKFKEGFSLLLCVIDI